MIFQDRIDAGRKLAEKLSFYKDVKGVIVVGLPRGGVVLAAEVAKELHAPLDVICTRKIGAPFNKEYAIGAITETGQFVGDDATIQGMGVSGFYLENEIELEKEKARRRLEVFREGRPPRNLRSKIVILVDDGLATGMTMKAAIQTAKDEGALKVIVAVPVSPGETLMELEELADEVYCLATPPYFQAVGQFYHNFKQVEDDEVVALMKENSK